MLDLDGDGIETSALGTQGRDSDVYFDHDRDFFAERTGWLDGDDSFLALDKNGNGRGHAANDNVLQACAA